MTVNGWCIDDKGTRDMSFKPIYLSSEESCFEFCEKSGFAVLSACTYETFQGNCYSHNISIVGGNGLENYKCHHRKGKLQTLELDQRCNCFICTEF